MFYCTNTAGKICLSNAELALSESNDLLIVSSGRWGKEGRNGGECELYAKNQELKGNISVDSMSSLLMDLRSSTFSGAIQGEGNVNVSMDSDSRWVLSGDSSVTSLDGDLSGLDMNGHQLYINGVLYGE